MQPTGCVTCGAETAHGDRFCRQCGADLDAAPRTQSRKNVTVLFIDLIGSTSLAEWLDPEPLRTLMDRYYRACAEAIGEHGGIIEKYIGDAIMAVFGMPLANEDDAFRAIRAALDTVTAVRDLDMGLDVHCGIFAGEVIATPMPNGELRVVGDAVNTAARLQSAAGAGQILIGKTVAQAVRDSAELRTIAPLTLKGKAKPVPVWLVTGLRAGAGDRPATGFVGRADELDQLHQVFRRVVDERECRIVTVLSPPGMGKTRLVREFLAQLPGEQANVVVGHCQSYGKGITYRPIAEMVEARRGARPTIDATLAALPDGSRVIRGLAAVTGQEIQSGVEEIAWAVRRLFEVLASDRPLIAVCDDLHWAEPTLLNLLDDLVAGLAGLPVMLVCLARPELTEARPAWGRGQTRAMTLDLPPLSPVHMHRLVRELTHHADVVAHSATGEIARVVEASGGNPLFAELMVDMLAEGDDTIPPTVQALLAARVDRLLPAERAVLDRAATFGRQFGREGLSVLHDSPDDLPSLLVRVQRRRLVEPAANATYQFTQALTREVVYAMIPKALRRDWHLQVADWLTEPPEAAHHLESACLLAMEVAPGAPGNEELARRAAGALAEAGTQALSRKDLPAAAELLERARELMPSHLPEHRILIIRLCDAWLGLGMRDKAFGTLDRSEPAFSHDQRGLRTLEIQRQLLAVRFGMADMSTLGAMCDRFEADLADDPDDHLGWCRAHQLRAMSWLVPGQVGQAETAMWEAVTRARTMGDRYEEERLLIGHCEMAQWSPSPVDTGLALCADLSARFAGDRALLVVVMVTRARLLALRGDLADARDILDRALRHSRDLHLTLARIAVTQVRGLVESLAGAHQEAERLFGEAASEATATGQPLPARTLRIYAARELLRAGGRPADVLAMLPAEDSALELRAELVATCVRARCADEEDADRLVGAALALMAQTDDPCLRGDALAEIAHIRFRQGRADLAIRAASQARDLYSGRGAMLPAGRVSAWLAVHAG